MTADDVGIDNLIDIGGGDPAVPHAFRIDDQIGTVLTLVQAARLVSPHLVFQTAFRESLFEDPLQFGFALRITAPARMSRRPLVAAHKDMLLELRHVDNVPDLGQRRCTGEMPSTRVRCAPLRSGQALPRLTPVQDDDIFGRELSEAIRLRRFSNPLHENALRVELGEVRQHRHRAALDQEE